MGAVPPKAGVCATGAILNEKASFLLSGGLDSAFFSSDGGGIGSFFVEEPSDFGNTTFPLLMPFAGRASTGLVN